MHIVLHFKTVIKIRESYRKLMDLVCVYVCILLLLLL